MSEQTETLRRAAALMRERAEDATANVCPVWTYQAVRHIARNCEIECYHDDDDPLVEKFHDTDGMPETWTRYNDANHIASWHPAVALAVADWLEQEADDLDSDPDAPTYDEADLHPCMQRAIKAARAYLGESA